MKTKFDRFKLNENVKTPEKINMNKHRGYIQENLEDLIYHMFENEKINFDQDSFWESDAIYNMREKIIDTLINTLDDTIPKFEYNSYDYQKYMIDMILNEETGMVIKDFLEELEENNAKIHPDIQEEYGYLFDATNMGLL